LLHHRNITAWLGNELQEDAFNRLYSLSDKIQKCTDPKLLTDWKYLQTSDNFYYMCTKVFSDGEVHSYFNPFDSPYDAYINYMNILSDFIIRLNAAVPESKQDQELATLASIIFEKNKIIEDYEAEIKQIKDSKNGAGIQKSATKKNITTITSAIKPKEKAVTILKTAQKPVKASGSKSKTIATKSTKRVK
jgi:alpha-amylase